MSVNALGPFSLLFSQSYKKTKAYIAAQGKLTCFFVIRYVVMGRKYSRVSAIRIVKNSAYTANSVTGL